MGTAQRRQREAENRRKAILSAAREVFWKQGYHKATMPQVAEAAELATGTLYLYFPSKDALYVELLIEGYELLVPRLGAAARSGGDLSQVGGRLIDNFFAFAREFPEYFDILFFILQREKSGWERFPEEQIPRLEAKEQACKNIVASVLERLPGGTPQTRMRTVDAIWSMLAGVVFYFRNRNSFDAVSAEARQLLLTAMFGHKD
jgi:AcrR family transcriptional regulator